MFAFSPFDMESVGNIPSLVRRTHQRTQAAIHVATTTKYNDYKREKTDCQTDR